MKNLKTILHFLQVLITLILYPKGRHSDRSHQSVSDNNNARSDDVPQHRSSPGSNRGDFSDGSPEKPSAVNILGWLLIATASIELFAGI